MQLLTSRKIHVRNTEKPTSVLVCGTGSRVPEQIIPNDWFAGRVETNDEWIRTRTGILERRFVSEGQSTTTMALDAARKALANSDLDAKDLDMIICATVTPDMMCPAVACQLQAQLECRNIPSFDVSAACTGFIYALSIAEQFIRSGAAQHILVVGSESLSRAMDLTDRNSCILFGDGAGAVILGASDVKDVGIHSVNVYADGTLGHLITVPSMHTKQISQGTRSDFLEMNGREVFKFAVRKMIELMQEGMEQCHAMGKQLDLVVPHQVNKRIIDAALEQNGFPADQVMVNLQYYGNTSAASVPIALDEAVTSGKAKPGDTLLLIAFGGGLTWGSSLITL
ncbi:MAG: beta-ketoacyl-ACP synthase III [Zavarzinella sp.]